MRLKSAILFLAFALFFVLYGSYVSVFNINARLDEPAMIEASSRFYDYAGSTHVHTLLSSGSKDYAGIINEAQDAGLNFIYFTDLHQLPAEQKIEGYHNDLLVFRAVEYSYLDAEILNYHSTAENIFKSPAQAQLYLSDLLSKDKKDPKFGLFVLSHPTKPNNGWDGKLPEGLDGIEVLNLKSIWQKNWLNSTGNFIWSMFLYPFNKNLSLLRLFKTDNKNLDLWKAEIVNQKLIGFVGSDAEANVRLSKNKKFSFPNYATIFSVAKNHLLLNSELTGNVDNDRDKVQNAIRAGQFYFSLDVLGDPKGFEAYVISKKNEIHPIGADIALSDAQELVVNIPFNIAFEFNLSIYKNGKKMMTSNSKETRYKINEPGAYNVIVSVKVPLPFPEKSTWFDWIYTNAFYINK